MSVLFWPIRMSSTCDHWFENHKKITVKTGGLVPREHQDKCDPEVYDLVIEKCVGCGELRKRAGHKYPLRALKEVE